MESAKICGVDEEAAWSLCSELGQGFHAFYLKPHALGFSSVVVRRTSVSRRPGGLLCLLVFFEDPVCRIIGFLLDVHMIHMGVI